jgi:hypothetical protein
MMRVCNRYTRLLADNVISIFGILQYKWLIKRNLLLQIRLELNELNEAIVHDFTSINVSVLRSLSPLDKIWR